MDCNHYGLLSVVKFCFDSPEGYMQVSVLSRCDCCFPIKGFECQAILCSDSDCLLSS